MPQGLMITGTVHKSGKTVACAGIAACLADSGFQVHAGKPIVINGANHPIPEFNVDQRFIDMVSRPLASPETILLPSPEALDPLLWKRLLDQLRNAPYPLVLESPSTVASPIRYPQDVQFANAGGQSSHSITDAIDFARLLKIGVLLVTPKSENLYAELAPALAYCAMRHEQPVGWLAVGTSEDSHFIPNWEQLCMLITRDFKIPYFGEIGYSPSISVEECQQGNLLRHTESGVDLLPIQQAMEMAIF